MRALFSRSRPAAAAAVVGALLALAGCSDDRRTLNCPGVAILADTAMRPVLKPGALPTDPAAVLYSVRAENIETTCTLNQKQGVTDSNVTITFRATRPPSGQAARYVVPYFLAINQEARVLNKRMFNIEINFPAGSSSVTAETTITNTELHLENGRLPQDYQFIAGFPLSADEQAYVKAMAPYTP